MAERLEFREFLHDEVDSTSERAFAALAAGEARHGDVHVARSQTAGRGRLGRHWESPRDAGLWASFVLLPGAPPLSPTALTMAAGLALLDALVELGAERVPAESWRPWPRHALRLDWPNDVVAGGAKLAGLLVESRGLDPAAPQYVLGVGVDVEGGALSPELAAERDVTGLAALGLPGLLDPGPTEPVPPAQAPKAGPGLAPEPRQVLDALERRLPPRLAAVRADVAGLARDYLAATGLERRVVRARIGSGDRAREYEGLLEQLDPIRGVSVRMKAGEGVWLALEHLSALAAVHEPWEASDLHGA